MSIVSVELHGGEIQKLVQYCYEAYVADPARFVYKKGLKSHTTEGLCESGDRRCFRAEQKLATFTKALTPEQRELIDVSFSEVVEYQKMVQKEGLSNYRKRQVAAEYKKAAGKYEKVIKITSTTITHDLNTHMGRAEAYQMAAACSENDADALEMANGIMSAFEGSLPKTAPKPRKAKTISDKTASKAVPAVMMKHVADCVKLDAAKSH